MGRVIEPTELKGIASDIGAAAAKYAEGLEAILPTIDAFASDDGLKGRSWRA